MKFSVGFQAQLMVHVSVKVKVKCQVNVRLVKSVDARSSHGCWKGLTSQSCNRHQRFGWQAPVSVQGMSPHSSRLYASASVFATLFYLSKTEPKAAGPAWPAAATGCAHRTDKTLRLWCTAPSLAAHGVHQKTCAPS